MIIAPSVTNGDAIHRGNGISAMDGGVSANTIAPVNIIKTRCGLAKTFKKVHTFKCWRCPMIIMIAANSQPKARALAHANNWASTTMEGKTALDCCPKCIGKSPLDGKRAFKRSIMVMALNIPERCRRTDFARVAYEGPRE